MRVRINRASQLLHNSPSGLMDKALALSIFPIWNVLQQSGAAEACWAHNPEVDGSKPSSAKRL